MKIPSSTIISANQEVETVLSKFEADSAGEPPRKQSGGSYDRFTPEEKATIARAAINNGVTRTVNKYNKDLQECKLTLSRVGLIIR